MIYSGTTRAMKHECMIISGGQTGSDRAALDFALEHKMPCGGYCPKGRRSESGPIPRRYPMEELPRRSYAARTKKNVEVSDGTLIFLWRKDFQKGTLLTMNHCHKIGRPCFVYRLNNHNVQQAQKLRQWLDSNQVAILNVAGNREGDDPGIYRMSLRALHDIFPDH